MIEYFETHPGVLNVQLPPPDNIRVWIEFVSALESSVANPPLEIPKLVALRSVARRIAAFAYESARGSGTPIPPRLR